MAAIYRLLLPFRTSKHVHPIVRSTAHQMFVRQASTGDGEPKRPASAFISFYLRQKSTITSNQPGLSVMEISKAAAEQWRSLPEGQRKDYLAENRRQFEEYSRTRREYLDSLPEDERAKIEEVAAKKRLKRAIHKRKMLVKELNKPTRGTINGFMCYCTSNMLERGDAPIQQFIKGLAEYWKRMAVEDKQPFEDQASANRLKYQQELLSWEQEMTAEGRPELVRGYRADKASKKGRKKKGKPQSEE